MNNDSWCCCYALADAIEEGDFVAVQRILKKNPSTDVNYLFEIPGPTNISDNTLLSRAIRSNHKTIVEVLLAHGAAANGPVGAYKTPLQQACIKEIANEDIVKLLLEQGADVDAVTDHDRRTPLSLACLSNTNSDIVQLLINAGGDVNGSGGGDVAPLHEAASYANSEAIELLIDAGADVNILSTEDYYALSAGSTPLYFAVADGDLSCVAVLLAAGADPNIANADGETPLLRAAAYSSSHNVINALLAGGADPNIAYSWGQTPLHRAATSCCYSSNNAVNALLAAGADPNIADISGQTPLHEAAFRSSVDVVAALLTAGCDPLHQDNDGLTPVQYQYEERRTRNFYGERLNIITALVAAGDRSWECVPTPCPGLEAAMLSVWQNAPDELPEVVKRLKNPPQSLIELFPRMAEEMKKVVQEVLRGLHRHYAGYPEVKELLLKFIFNV